MAPLNLPVFAGWHLIGAYPQGDPDAVGSWLLCHHGEALLLEVPEELAVADVSRAVQALGVRVRYVTASHEHYDHLDPDVWISLQEEFPDARFMHPADTAKGRRNDLQLSLGGEPVWLLKAPKHSPCDLVTVFRGVAMTGDIELGTLDSVSDEVPLVTRRWSMKRLAEFPARSGYHVHSIVSAHLNDVRQGIDWPDLFTPVATHA